MIRSLSIPPETRPFASHPATNPPVCLQTGGLSRVLDHDVLEDVRDRLGRVDPGLEPLVDVLPTAHDDRVDSLLEEPPEGLAQQTVTPVFEPVDLDAFAADAA